MMPAYRKQCLSRPALSEFGTFGSVVLCYASYTLSDEHIMHHSKPHAGCSCPSTHRDYFFTGTVWSRLACPWRRFYRVSMIPLYCHCVRCSDQELAESRLVPFTELMEFMRPAYLQNAKDLQQTAASAKLSEIYSDDPSAEALLLSSACLAEPPCLMLPALQANVLLCILCKRVLCRSCLVILELLSAKVIDCLKF